MVQFKYSAYKKMHGRVTDNLTNFPGPFFRGRGGFVLSFSLTWDRTAQNSGDVGQSSVISEYVLDFICFAPFRNAGDSKGTGVKNRDNFWTLHPCKIRAGLVKMSESVFQVQSGIQPFVYFWRGPVRDIIWEIQYNKHTSTLSAVRRLRRRQPAGMRNISGIF